VTTKAPRPSERASWGVWETASVPGRSAKDHPASSVEGAIDRLYSLDPDQFTKERNETAKRLREQGDPAASDRIKGLRRPTVAAWAVNQLPRRRRDLVDDLLEAGVALRAAQRSALSGPGRGDLRGATQARRAAVARLLDEATALLEEAGRNPAPHADAIRSTLEAASTDEATGDLLRSGQLTKDVEPPSGLGDGSPFEVLSGGRASARSEAAGEGPPAESAATRRLRERMEERVAKAEDALIAAREGADEARREAAAVAKEVDRLERELRTARSRAERAAKAATAAEARAQESERALERAQADLDADT